MTGLTTHVLDTASGKPAEGLKIELFMSMATAPPPEDGDHQRRRPRRWRADPGR
jgi:hypothetical protein